MLKALIRYLFFEAPCYFITGLAFILFDKVEIIQCRFDLRRQFRPDIKKQVLQNYLNKCYKQVYKDEGANKVSSPDDKTTPPDEKGE